MAVLGKIRSKGALLVGIIGLGLFAFIAEEAVRSVGTVEGYPCAKTAYELGQKLRVEMPIVEQSYAVLYEGKSPAQALRDLMTRPKRHESEVIWLLGR